MEIVDTTQTRLKLDKLGAGIQMVVSMRDGKLEEIILCIDKNKGSSLPSKWEDIRLGSGLADLKTLWDFCDEMIPEIEKRLR